MVSGWNDLILDWSEFTYRFEIHVFRVEIYNFEMFVISNVLRSVQIWINIAHPCWHWTNQSRSFIYCACIKVVHYLCLQSLQRYHIFFLLSFHMFSNIMLNSSEISYDMSLICTNIPNCSWTMQRLCFLKSIKLIKMKVVFLVFCVNGKYQLLRKLTTCKYVCSGLWTSLGKRKYNRNCLRSLFRNFIQVHWQIDNTDMQVKRKRHDYQKS